MILLVGPSAVGKTEVGKRLSKDFGYEKLITYTTRPIRDGEVQDVDYHFITVQEFLLKQEDDFFFESVFYSTNYYGTAISDIKCDKYVIVDPNGLKRYKESGIFCVAFYLDATPSVRMQRMMERNDSSESIERRMELDEKHFSKDIKKRCDFTLHVDKMSIEKIAKKINHYYMKKKK